MYMKKIQAQRSVDVYVCKSLEMFADIYTRLNAETVPAATITMTGDYQNFTTARLQVGNEACQKYMPTALLALVLTTNTFCSINFHFPFARILLLSFFVLWIFNQFHCAFALVFCCFLAALFANLRKTSLFQTPADFALSLALTRCLLSASAARNQFIDSSSLCTHFFHFTFLYAFVFQLPAHTRTLYCIVFAFVFFI